jgi:hypothetical protein
MQPKRTLHRKQLPRLFFSHQEYLSDIAPAEHLDLLEAAGSNFNLSIHVST